MISVDGQIFLSTSEVALRFGVSSRTILRWHESKPKELGAVTGVNGRTYFRKEAVDQTIQNIYFAANLGSQKQKASHRSKVSRNLPMPANA